MTQNLVQRPTLRRDEPGKVFSEVVTMASRGVIRKIPEVKDTEIESNGEESYGKRIRVEEKIFGKSKMTRRTPTRKNESGKGTEDTTLNEMMKALMERSDGKIEQNRKLEKELQETNNKLEQIEKDQKKENVVITGVSIKTANDKILKVQIKEKLELEFEVTRAGREAVEVKESFYEELANVIDDIDEESIVVGDHDGRFRHKETHKLTWERRSKEEKSIIVWIRIKDVRMYRGYEVGTDHYMLKAKIQVQKENSPKDMERTSNDRIRGYKIKDSEAKTKCQKELEKSMINALTKGSLDWENIQGHH
ncbi:hypothetical protein ILUMI_03418 [Ignelater luminosus]|uniref:Uncharacterized protein n=1 Tax=Ignelater luminosus TaxID=2038154 RepID=A0A8K0GM71_IGNLU|nr:hypothetical protein ILUMI_03418 [Ignelater luminosus]